MNRKKLIRTIALTLAVASVSAVSPLNKESVGLFGTVIAQAATTADIQCTTDPGYGSITPVIGNCLASTTMVYSDSNYTLYMTPYGGNINIIAISSTGVVTSGSFSGAGGTMTSITAVNVTSIAGNYWITYYTTMYAGSALKVNVASMTSGASGTLGAGKNSTPNTLTALPSFPYGTATLINTTATDWYFYVTSPSPWYFNGSATSVVKVPQDTGKFSARLNYAINYTYKNSTTGKPATSAVSSISTVTTGTTSLPVSVPTRCQYDYTEIDSWSPDMSAQINSPTTFTAHYVESADSFWQDGNRYGIISGTSNVTFLGSTNAVANIPTTVTNNGTVYSVTAMQNDALTNNTVITDLTMDSSLANAATTTNSSLASLTLTGSTTFPANYFKLFTGLKTVELSNYSNTTISASSFNASTSIKSVKLGSSIKSIGASAFYGCTALNSINTTNITSLGTSAFYGCSLLPTVDISNITSVPATAFYGCGSLSSVKTGSSIVSVGANAFVNCTLLPNIDLSSVTTLDNTAFMGCTSLKWIKTNQAILQSTTIGITPYKEFFYSEDQTTMIGTYFCSANATLANTQSIPTKAGYTFIRWDRISGTSTIANIIDSTQFYPLYQIGGIVVADPTLTLSTETAANRDSTVVATVGGIVAGNSYYYTLDGTEPTSTNGTLLAGTTINIPKQDQDAEKIITVKVAGTKSGIYSNTVSASVTYLAGTVGAADPTFVQDGITYSEHADGTATLVSAVGKAGAVSIPYTVDGHSVTEIALGAFKNCTGITSVTIPNTVSKIGANAFQGCTGLKSVVIPPTVTSLNGGTFSGCTGLTTMKIPDSITSMATSEFNGCTNLKIIEANPTIVNSSTLTGYYKVSYIDDDEAITFGTYYVKPAVSMVGKEPAPLKANYTFSKWTRYTPTSVSTLGNIQDNVTFEAVYNSTPGTSGPGQVSKAELTPSKTNASNREGGVIITIK